MSKKFNADQLAALELNADRVEALINLRECEAMFDRANKERDAISMQIYALEARIDALKMLILKKRDERDSAWFARESAQLRLDTLDAELRNVTEVYGKAKVAISD